MKIRVARLDDLQLGQPTLVEAGGTRLALARVGDSVYALGDTCSHQGGPLSQGRQRGTRLVCPWHGWMYDVKTGQCVMPGRGAAVPTYPVHVEAGEVWVEVP